MAKERTLFITFTNPCTGSIIFYLHYQLILFFFRNRMTMFLCSQVQLVELRLIDRPWRICHNRELKGSDMLCRKAQKKS